MRPRRLRRGRIRINAPRRSSLLIAVIWLLAVFALEGVLALIRSRQKEAEPQPVAADPPLRPVAAPVRLAAIRPKEHAPMGPPLPPFDMHAALQARAATLSECHLPPGAEHRLAVTLTIQRDGRVSRTMFDREATLPRDWLACVRPRILQWQIDGLRLTRPLEAFVEFDLGG